MRGEYLRRPSKGAVVVFVHGILSGGETCWQNRNGTYWPELLKNEPAAADWGIYVYSYRTGFFSGTYSMNDAVDDLKERFFNLDELAKCRRIVFVCHSMGGILVRKFLVERINDLLDRNIDVGLFLVASPSLGSDYADWLKPLAELLGHTQADALRFSQQNNWLNDLDKAFKNLKESGRLKLVGKELIEDQFVVLPGLIRKQVVEPFSGARFFGESYKVPGSDHSSIAKPDDAEAVQHRLLLAFLAQLAPAPAPEFKSGRNCSVSGKRIFISYRRTKPDEDLAVQMENAFLADKQQVFVDRRISVGTEWAAEIDKQLRLADIFIVLLSENSILSDMVRQEIMLAHQLRQQGKLLIFPVRVNYTGALPYDLGGYLNPLQYVTWTGDHATQDVIDALARAIHQNANPPDPGYDVDLPDSIERIDSLDAATEQRGIPLPQVDPRLLERALEKGTMHVDSQFYIRRETDDDMESFIKQSGNTVIVKGARQMGKSSLLVRAALQAKNQGKQVCSIDFQAIDESRLATLDNLLLYLTSRIARDLKTPRKPQDYWDGYLGSKDSATDFIEDAVLACRTAEVVLILDEADRVFSSAYRNDFFGLLRFWTNRGADHDKPQWRRFNLVIAHSTDPVLWIDDITQSPFNVGLSIRLEDFNIDQLAELSNRYGLKLSDTELNDLHSLIGGQPYLCRQGLYRIASEGWEPFRNTVLLSDGPYGDHLRRLTSVIAQNETLRKAVLQILQARPCDDEQAFQKLRAAGVLLGETRQDARLRCRLYRDYFRDHL